MFFTPIIMHLVSLLLALAVTTRATPVALSERDSIAPPITQPTAKTVWKTGETQTVTWDLSGLAGVQPSNPTAQILLGTLSADGSIHLLVSTPIASGFPILGGNVSLVVPSVASGGNYIVCLFGSTRDISPAFTIVGTNPSASASSSAAASTQVDAASSSNTLPPHQTSDPSTSVSLPTGVPQTDPSSGTTSSSVPTATATSPSGATTTTSSSSSATSSPSASVPTGVLPSGASVSSSASTSETGSPTGGVGNSCARVAVTNMHLYSALVAGLALWVLW